MRTDVVVEHPPGFDRGAGLGDARESVQVQTVRVALAVAALAEGAARRLARSTKSGFTFVRFDRGRR